MDYEADRITKSPLQQPSLSEMTEKAIKILQNGDNGYFLFVEGKRQFKTPIQYVRKMFYHLLKLFVFILQFQCFLQRDLLSDLALSPTKIAVAKAVQCGGRLECAVAFGVTQAVVYGPGKGVRLEID